MELHEQMLQDLADFADAVAGVVIAVGVGGWKMAVIEQREATRFALAAGMEAFDA